MAAAVALPPSIMVPQSLSPSTSSNSLSSSSNAASMSVSSSSNPPTRSSSSTSLTKAAADLTPKSRRTTRIRFAPLPDPRRAVLVTEEGEELPLPPPPGSNDATELTSISIRDIPISSTPSSENGEIQAIEMGLRTDSPVQLPDTPATANSALPPLQEQLSQPEQPQKKSKSWLTPWKRKSTSSAKSSSPLSLTPTPSIQSDPSAVTINLLRTTSRESTASTQSQGLLGGLGLQRWSSTTSGKTPLNSPLTRTFSAQSANMPSKKRAKRPASASGGFHIGAAGSRRGQRMLNGRVYGAQKNPFANVRDSEPDFVEWGYGGMGSVKSAGGSSGADWGKLQGGTALQGHGDGSSEKENQATSPSAAIAASHDEDDGSGMGWIRKRREQREKERKEREEREAKEAAEAEAAAAGDVAEDAEMKPKEGVGVEADATPEDEHSKSSSAEHTPTPSRRPTLTPITPIEEASAAPTPQPSSMDVKPASPASPSREPSEQHVLEAVNVPPTQRRPSHSHSRSIEKIPSPSIPQPSKTESISSSSGSSADDSSSEAEDNDSDEEDEDDDDDEDDLGHDGCQIKGAGVEKFTRHKE